MNVKFYKTALLLFIVVFSSCLNGKKITLKDHSSSYEFVLYENDYYFHVDLYSLKKYFEKKSFKEMISFTDSLMKNKVKDVDISLLREDLQKNIFSISEYQTLIFVALKMKNITIYSEGKKINKIKVVKSSNYKFKYIEYYYGDNLIIKSSTHKKNKINVY